MEIDALCDIGRGVSKSFCYIIKRDRDPGKNRFFDRQGNICVTEHVRGYSPVKDPIPVLRNVFLDCAVLKVSTVRGWEEDIGSDVVDMTCDG